MTSLPELPDSMTRREAIRRVSALFGGAALVGHGALLTACATSGAQRAPAGQSATSGGRRDSAGFTPDEIAFLDEVADTILPETGTPGAKAAGVGPFMALMVTDAYDETQQQVFRDGMRTLDEECVRSHGRPFMSATPAQRLSLLERLDVEQFEYTRARAPGSPPHYFRMMKELSLLGYFTSEIGYRQAMRYVETPGRFDPCAPYAPGEKTWAPHA
jgi:hypothetical protein